MEAKTLRKYQNTLVFTGMSVIVFGIWSLLKTLYLLLFDPTYVDGTNMNRLAISIAIIIVTLLDLAMRYYIGRKAITIGMDRPVKKPRMYLVIAIIDTIILLTGFILSVTSSYSYSEHVARNLAGFLVDLTSIVIMVEMIIAGFKVRQLKAKQEV